MARVRRMVNAVLNSALMSVKKSYAPMINTFYDLVTDFYEYGWGQSFHFAPRWKNENFEASLARAEHFIAAKLGLKDGDTCLDLGCGVGGKREG